MSAPRHGLVAGDVARSWWWAAWCNAWGAIGCSYGAEMALALALERQAHLNLVELMAFSHCHRGKLDAAVDELIKARMAERAGLPTNPP